MRNNSRRNINFKMVLRVIGWLLTIEALFMLIPIGVSIYFGETREALMLGLSAAITLLSGLAMTWGLRDSNNVMRKREGILLTSTVWFFFSLFGMLPFLLCGTLPTVTDAFFETMAGFTTTGATMIRDVDHTARGILMWRSLMQWIGGMGIILFTLAVLPMLNYRGGVSLFNSEVTGITHERLRPRVSQTAKDLWLIYLILTVAMAVMLLLGDMDWFDAVCHTLSTVSTGGFSTRNGGIWAWNSDYINTVVIVFMLLCGINFTLIFKLVWRGDWRALRDNDTFKWYFMTLTVISAIIVMWMWLNDAGGDWKTRIELAMFDVLSAITSTGFSSLEYADNGEFILLLIMVLMFFGGMAGSTSGGAKIDRMMVLLKNTKNELYRTIHPNAVTPVRVDGRSLPHIIVERVIAFLAIYVLIIISVGVALTMMGIPIFDALFTSMSTLSNMGFGCGVTNGIGAYANLPIAAKWILSIEMLIGRLELFTVLVLFTRPFWVKE